MVTLAMLWSTGLPAATRAQANRPTVTSATENGGDKPSAGVSSPANRFAAVAARAQIDLPQPSNRAPKRSVLEPAGPRWLEDESPEPPQAARSPGGLASDFPSPFAGGPGPEAMPEEIPPPAAADPLADTDELMPAGRGRLFDRLPHVPPARPPMMRESWQFRPFNLSIFEGALLVTPPIPAFRNGAGFLTGFRVGWDFATHFGGETRFGFSKVFLLDAARSTEIGYEKIFYFDANLLYYPLGDTKWRPFFSLGGGLADVQIVSNSSLHPTAFNMPFGGGIKYRYGSRVAFRFDIRDNLTFSGSGGLRTLNNAEFLGGIEFHFGGGERRSYWPWNPSRHWW
jgi:hypothetical protein